MWQELQMPQWKEGKPAILISDFGCWLRYYDENTIKIEPHCENKYYLKRLAQ